MILEIFGFLYRRYPVQVTYVAVNAAGWGFILALVSLYRR